MASSRSRNRNRFSLAGSGAGKDADGVIDLSDDEGCPSTGMRNRVLSYAPTGDVQDKIELFEEDMERLPPGMMLNDRIINFFLRYLRHNAPPSPARVYICNTFLYRQIETDTEKAIAWLRREKIFSFEFVLFPVHIEVHWILVMAYRPGEALRPPAPPGFVVLDSLGASNKKVGPKALRKIRPFFRKAWAAEHGDDVPLPLDSRAREHKIEVPQQSNDFDCGLFLLLFVERFLRNPILAFDAIFANRVRKWFEPAQASALRTRIEQTVRELARVEATRKRKRET